MKAAKKIIDTSKRIFTLFVEAATSPAKNKSESPGIKKATSTPVSKKMITPMKI
jgi:hypothetical protein